VNGAGTNAAPVCAYITPAPCGGGPAAGAPTAAFVAGQATTISMQKNQDHFYAASPGNFSVYLWDAAGDSTYLGTVPDTNAPSLSLFPLSVIVPSAAQSGNYTLQTIYYPNNVAAPAAFYQCSDVQVL
jgi:hypothetical protein